MQVASHGQHPKEGDQLKDQLESKEMNRHLSTYQLSTHLCRGVGTRCISPIVPH